VEKENIQRDAMIEERDLMEKLLSPAELELFVSFDTGASIMPSSSAEHALEDLPNVLFVPTIPTGKPAPIASIISLGKPPTSPPTIPTGNPPTSPPTIPTGSPPTIPTGNPPTIPTGNPPPRVPPVYHMCTACLPAPNPPSNPPSKVKSLQSQSGFFYNRREVLFLPYHIPDPFLRHLTCTEQHPQRNRRCSAKPIEAKMHMTRQVSAQQQKKHKAQKGKHRYADADHQC
jgi:hypothetical protein